MSTTFLDLPDRSGLPRGATPFAQEDLARVATVKRLIWLYFWLLIFEGALRKWFLPQLSNPLLIIRDPVVVMIYVAAIVARVFPANGFITATFGLGIISALVSEIFGSGTLPITLYGFRTNFLHLPLIFVVANVFDESDLRKITRWFLILSIPMCLLVLAQFRAAPDHWLNNGAGGAQNGQLEVGYGKIRAAGTFSFSSVMTLFLAALSALAINAQITVKREGRLLAGAALCCLGLMVVVSGSRSSVGTVGLTVAALTLIAFRKPALFGSWLKFVIMGGVLFVALGSWSEFRQGLEIHQYRFGDATNVRANFFGRAVAEVLLPFQAVADARFFGVGLGMGTNAASGFMYGKITFDLGEGDLERIVRESGPILGFAFIALRWSLLLYLFQRSLAALDRDRPLPLLLFASCASHLLNGQFGVPSILGWAVFNASLCLAAANATPESPDTPTAPTAPPLNRFGPEPSSRGRSSYADELHGQDEDPLTSRYGP